MLIWNGKFHRVLPLDKEIQHPNRNTMVIPMERMSHLPKITELTELKLGVELNDLEPCWDRY